MSVYICVVTTLNGLITAGVPHEQWVSEASWQSYVDRLKTMDVAIVGSKTYDVMTEEEFVAGTQYVVMSHDASKTVREGVEVSSESPAQLIARLKQAGHETIGILGGAEVASEFLEAQVVDEIYLDLASALSGKGKNLLTDNVGVYKLELLDVQQLDAKTLQLHYKVLARV